MAKFYGVVGYIKDGEHIEDPPGVWKPYVKERPYYGDVLDNAYRWESGEKVNDDFTLNHRISIVADTYANENFFAIKYIRWMGANWKVTNATVQRPRILLTIGGVYNGPTPSTP